MSSMINSNILKKSEVTVLIYLIILELIKLTVLIKPVFHNAMWNGVNYMPVIWFFIDCLCSSLSVGVWKNPQLVWLVPTRFSFTSKYCPHLSFYPIHFPICKGFFKIHACVLGHLFQLFCLRYQWTRPWIVHNKLEYFIESNHLFNEKNCIGSVSFLSFCILFLFILDLLILGLTILQLQIWECSFIS